MKVTRALIGYLSRSVHSKTKPEVILRNIKTKPKAQSVLHALLIAMPKEQVHIPHLKSQRTQKKEVASKFPAGYINLEVLGNGAKGAPASLYVFTDQTRYLFNCGEGTQRLAHEHRMKLAKLEHVFITNSSWKNLGGVPGVALTIQDIGVPIITIHGPPGLENLFEGTRRFVILKDLQIRVADCVNDSQGYYEDHVMRINYVTLVKKGTNENGVSSEPEPEPEPESLKEKEEDKIDYYAPIKGSKRNLEVTQGGITKKLKGELEKDQFGRKIEKQADTVICYICRPKKKPGALLIEKCMDYGVPAGPLLGKLKRGEDVTLPNGTIVKAADVRSPDAPCTVFLVVDCPTEEYLDSFITNEELLKFHGDVPVDDIVHVIIHFTPKEMLKSSKYIEWMEKFRISTQHILLNNISEGMGSEAVHRVQYKLNLLDPYMFPLLKDSYGIDHNKKRTEFVSNTQLQITQGVTQYRYKLRPEIGVDNSIEVKFNPMDFVKEAMDIPEFEFALNNLKRQFSQLTTSDVEYPKIIFLGTGSCIPNKTRNTSGILLQISESKCIILDCGEGTYGQLVRFFGPIHVDEILIKLSGIFVSHLHADHHLGLINLLQQREDSFKKQNIPFHPVFLISPHQIQSWLHLYDRNFEKLIHLYDLVGTTSLIIENSKLDPSFEKKFYEELNVKKIETVEVRHCPNAYGISIKGISGWKITYSGDTMPCDYLTTLGKDSDLLIHEATMEDELKDEALVKMHSTTSEAIEIGKKMNAKFIMLTHFSQRYSKVPKINGELDKNVGIAFDNMLLRLSDLWKVPMMYPILKTMFAESYDEMETKTAKKLRRKEREKMGKIE